MAVVAGHRDAQVAQVGSHRRCVKQLFRRAILRVADGDGDSLQVAVLVGDAGVCRGNRPARLALGEGDGMVAS